MIAQRRVHLENSANEDAMEGVYPAVPPFETWYKLEWVPVVQLVRGLTGSLAEAEDVAQEAFLRAHQNWESLALHPNREAWVRRVALNLATSHYRRALAKSRAVMRLGRPIAVGAADEQVFAESIWAAVVALPRRQAQCVALRYLEGLSSAEVALILGVAETTVRWHLAEAVKRLSFVLDGGT